MAGPVSKDEPVFLSAEEIGYDRKNAKVIALGKVQVIQGETILIADRLSYDQATNTVRATGNIALRQPDGNVLFADEVQLKDNMEAGVIENFRARMADDSLFAAREARRINKDRIEMDYAVYSPCELCEDSDPLWQLKAESVTLDQEQQKVFYEDAWVEFFGVPIAYTPYFSHATPDADAKSGFLTPELGGNSELGTFVRGNAYYRFNDQADITLSPAVFTIEAPMLSGEYRHLFENGYMQWRGSITNPDKRDGFGQREGGTEIRGHINAFGNFNLSENWDWGFNLHRSTDDTYLRRYNISNEDFLTSRIFAERVKDRQFTSIQGLSFQGLTTQDDSDITPLILPMVDFEYESDPGWLGSRYSFNASALALSRDIGAQSRRLTVGGSWSVPYVSDGGHVFEATTSLRGDLYSVEDVTRTGFAQEYDGEVSRVIPQLELSWRYPLLNSYARKRSFMIEPIAQFILSPKGVNNDKIPVEDSVVPEFNDSNLFFANRFAGYDRVETGPRFNFGVQGMWQFADETQFDFLLGQHYRTDEENPFPFNNDLTEELSDYVGRVAVSWDTNITTAYRFRLDRETLSPKRSEVNAVLNIQPVFLQVDYLNLNDDPFLDDRQEVVANASLAVTDYWTLFAGTRRDLNENEQTLANAGFRYQDECFGLFGNLTRSLIRDRDVEPSTSFILRVELENLN